MRYLFGNIWNHHDDSLIVIPTNIGWRSDGSNVMGRGLAANASDRYPKLSKWYGGFCKRHQSETPVYFDEETRLILFPTKPLNKQAPYLSWQSKSNLNIITKSLKELAELQKTVPDSKMVVPYVGCGNGGLPKRLVAPLLKEYLTSPNFYVIEE